MWKAFQHTHKHSHEWNGVKLRRMINTLQLFLPYSSVCVYFFRLIEAPTITHNVSNVYHVVCVNALFSCELVCRCTLIFQIMPHYTSRSTFKLIHMQLKNKLNKGKKRHSAHTRLHSTLLQQRSNNEMHANEQMNEWMNQQNANVTRHSQQFVIFFRWIHRYFLLHATVVDAPTRWLHWCFIPCFFFVLGLFSVFHSVVSECKNTVTSLYYFP